MNSTKRGQETRMAINTEAGVDSLKNERAREIARAQAAHWLSAQVVRHRGRSMAQIAPRMPE
ncbi:MAG: hypothetical protein BGO12_03015 [Verrucomicrobia bacterium 61-8]|nr:MAG: hypothetical protein BGO12_03015 [Verrucomicrobia bacterium 61-8]